MTQIIAVVGMHRSGTSALAQVLVSAGAWFGEPGMAAAATPKQPLGLVERKDVLALTNRILAAQGCSWHDVIGFRPDRDAASGMEFRQAFSRQVLAEFAHHPVAVLKDPRLCLLLPLVLPEMPETYGAMIVRHPLEVAASLHRRNNLPLEVGVALWEAYNRQALRSLQAAPSILVQHRQLIQKPKSFVTELVDRLGDLGVDGLHAQKALAARTINPNAYRQRAALLVERKMAPAQREFWKALRAADSPADIPIEPLSGESRRALEAHHANPLIRQPGAQTSPQLGEAEFLVSLPR